MRVGMESERVAQLMSGARGELSCADPTICKHPSPAA